MECSFLEHFTEKEITGIAEELTYQLEKSLTLSGYKGESAADQYLEVASDEERILIAACKVKDEDKFFIFDISEKFLDKVKMAITLYILKRDGHETLAGTIGRKTYVKIINEKKESAKEKTNLGLFKKNFSYEELKEMIYFLEQGFEINALIKTVKIEGENRVEIIEKNKGEKIVTFRKNKTNYCLVGQVNKKYKAHWKLWYILNVLYVNNIEISFSGELEKSNAN